MMGGSRTAHVAPSWIALIVILVALRLPSLVQPAGGDQGLYGYAGQRILAGDVMYRDMWDQKPPAIAFLYASFWAVWPREAVVPAADLAAAATVAWLLILLGRRRFTANVGYGAAALFLLLGDPYLLRLSGIYVRGQCEPFIALSVTAMLVLAAHTDRRRRHLILAGVALAMAFWLKYNAAAYVLPLALAVWAWAPPSPLRGFGEAGPPSPLRGSGEAGQNAPRDGRATLRDFGWIALGFGIVLALVIAYFTVNGALQDLRVATIDYNVRYSDETYASPASVLRYVIVFPIDRARMDMLWFLGGLGGVLLASRVRSNRSTAVICGWLLAAAISIAINGSRGLPNYFVQANPALALAASAGLAALGASSLWLRSAVVALLVVALWRVGTDTPVWGLRLASLPGLVRNVRYDLQYVRGRLDRDTYLRRFKGQKHDALEIEQLVRYVRGASTPADPIFVFGFSGGSVCWKSERASSSRFFWSRPVIIEFAADRPGYGSAGLLEDLHLRPPAVVALQKEEWRSQDFFMNHSALRSWLESEYRMDRETPMFSVWRRKL